MRCWSRSSQFWLYVLRTKPGLDWMRLWRGSRFRPISTWPLLPLWVLFFGWISKAFSQYLAALLTDSVILTIRIFLNGFRWFFPKYLFTRENKFFKRICHTFSFVDMDIIALNQDSLGDSFLSIYLQEKTSFSRGYATLFPLLTWTLLPWIKILLPYDLAELYRFDVTDLSIFKLLIPCVAWTNCFSRGQNTCSKLTLDLLVLTHKFLLDISELKSTDVILTSTTRNGSASATIIS